MKMNPKVCHICLKDSQEMYDGYPLCGKHSTIAQTILDMKELGFYAKIVLFEKRMNGLVLEDLR